MWPNHYPAACPPHDAVNADCCVYMYIKGQTPTASDFTSSFIKDPTGNYPSICQACGLSVFLSRESCEALSRVIRKFRGRMIAYANLTPEMGKIKQTPSRNSNYHYTWWMSINGDDAATHFRI